MLNNDRRSPAPPQANAKRREALESCSISRGKRALTSKVSHLPCVPREAQTSSASNRSCRGAKRSHLACFERLGDVMKGYSRFVYEAREITVNKIECRGSLCLDSLPV